LNGWNKFDLADSRVITEKEGEDLAKKLGILFLETSAKTAHNVGEAFETLVKEIPKTQSSYKNYDKKFLIIIWMDESI
jgi:translation elongation factor EF-4